MVGLNLWEQRGDGEVAKWRKIKVERRVPGVVARKVEFAT